jgi:hypothetical protein
MAVVIVSYTLINWKLWQDPSKSGGLGWDLLVLSEHE